MLGPRADLVWWLLEPVRWNAAFDTFLWPALGFLLAPWTTLMYVLVYPGGVDGFDYIWLGLAVAFDLFSWFGGAYGNATGCVGRTAPDGRYPRRANRPFDADPRAILRPMDLTFVGWIVVGLIADCSPVSSREVGRSGAGCRAWRSGWSPRSSRAG
jgi:hypothetical protein